MNKKLLTAMLCIMLALTGCSEDTTESTEDRSSDSLVFATGGTNGTYYGYGNVLADIISSELEDITVTVTSTGGSKENILLLSEGKVDMALVQDDVANYAINGNELFKDEGVKTGFYAAAALYPEVIQIVTAKDINSIEELRGRKVSVGASGSGVEINARQILEAYGMTFDDIEQFNLGFDDSKAAMEKEKLDAVFVTAGPPTDALTELSEYMDVNILSIDDEHANKLIDKYPFYVRYSLPAGMYKGIDSDIPTVTVNATLVFSDHVSDEEAYEITKCIFENKDAISAIHEKGNELDAEYAVKGISIPMHLGAQKYFHESGDI